jgi:succinate dehydrogenase / fumarate reductase cytochrome b subunit
MKIAILTNSMIQKAGIALSGLFLLFFLLFHLWGNLLLLDTPGRYNQLAQALENWGWIFHGLELLLLMALITHIWLTIAIRRQQKKFVPKYTHVRHKNAWAGSWAVNLTSRFMIITGPLILGFLIIHLQQFRFQPGERNLEVLVTHLFHHPSWVAWYELALLPVGLHVAHGFGSSLQSLGFGHEHFTPRLPRWSQILSVILILGYALIPLAIYWQNR